METWQRKGTLRTRKGHDVGRVGCVGAAGGDWCGDGNREAGPRSSVSGEEVGDEVATQKRRRYSRCHEPQRVGV